MKKQQFSINLNESDAWLFALFLKRITFDGVRECAVDKDETYSMIQVIENAMKQFAAQGIAPR
jgi:hypothetical protein